MAVSGINTYASSMYQWQNQKLTTSGSRQTQASSSLSSLFDGASMTDQISSMVELTKYAMDAMGVDSNSRVTFTQITKYRNQLEKEFNEGLKNGLANSGISNLNGLVFSLSSTGKLAVSGSNTQDRNLAQSWLDANPDIGQKLASTLAENNAKITGSIDFRLSSGGNMTVINSATTDIQNFLNDLSSKTDALRNILTENNLAGNLPLQLLFGDEGQLAVSPETPDAEKINAILKENSELADALKNELAKNSIDTSSVSLTFGKTGALQATVHNMELGEIQAGLDKASATGTQMANALSDLGIDPNISFTIQVDESGKIKVISDHPDRDKLQQFFESNPELVKKYRQIETLAGIDDARKAMQISPNAMRKRVQIESMAAWWASSPSASSWFGTYSNNSLSMLSGLNLNV